MRHLITLGILIFVLFPEIFAHTKIDDRYYTQILTSEEGHGGEYNWKMKKAEELASIKSEDISTDNVLTDDWIPAIVPGTVLNTLVHNGLYPEPYFGVNNKLESYLIPDISRVGRNFYTYWFRTEFDLDKAECYKKRTWIQFDGINYRAEIWLNGNMITYISGMFLQKQVDITDYITLDQKNILAIKVYPIDIPGTIKPKGSVDKSFGAKGEFHNGGDGEIGKNVSMLMTVGWDFSFLDGIRDRNTGIWKEISIFTTGNVKLRYPFVKSNFKNSDYKKSYQNISVEVKNPTVSEQKVLIVGEIQNENIHFEKEVNLFRGENQKVEFSIFEFPQLIMDKPRLWWPINKGKQELYDLSIKAYIKNILVDSISSRFGIREITSNTNTPDKSRTFFINGKSLFIRGANWLPENMLRLSDARTYAELRYTSQAGINLIRLWGGGIAESDYFFQLCDELGILVWQEFWMTGDTKHPDNGDLYLSNVKSTVKRVRNHPCLAYYVSSNESTEMPHVKRLISKIDGTRGYQMQSECEGIHDGSPYKQVNIMRHYANTASGRGSRIDGFNPEYGAPCLPTVECLREMMLEKDLWPINKEIWDYSDGNGFHLMSTLYADMTNEYGLSKSIDEFAVRAQFVGALNYKSIFETWNYNKLNHGDRYASGFLFWYLNSPIRQVCGRMWDWSLEPTAALYSVQNACEPLHPQFDYLKSTVSVVNNYYQTFNNYVVQAEVYDLEMNRVFFRKCKLDLPEDGVVNDIFKVNFPESITSVHFIKLRLFDENNHEVGSNFYWRSNSKYDAKDQLSGPTTGDFQGINTLRKGRLQIQYTTEMRDNKHVILLDLKNTEKSLAFFTQIQWLNGNLKPVRPSFYTKNFINLLPNESVSVEIETDIKNLPSGTYTLVVKGFNLDKQQFTIKI